MTTAHRSRKKKVSIVGAGSVGTAIAYACLIRGSADVLALYDTNTAKVRAEVLDLNHGTQFTPPCVVDGGDDIAVTAGSDLVIVTAGAKQKPGQSRLELAAVNVKIAQTLTEQLLAVSPDAVILFVSNPVDVVTFAAVHAVGPSYAGRIFGSGTVLDTARLRFLMASKLGVAVENVHAFIVGEHGDSEIPAWSSATIGGVPATEFVGLSGNTLDSAVRGDIARAVVQSAYEIIEGKGATNLAIGLSSAFMAEVVLRDEQRVLPISTLQDGVHGLEGVCLSLPTLVGGTGAGGVLELPLSAGEKSGLRASAETLREVQNSLGL
ncbi:L-lactate dehydrogenase [Rhodococcus sp. ARC_M6]|uniref:L-lactate dehydrogenase n=1 Tax=Rhodococcus sp. ARC_M6 TaxID=2928852 RepID=UPI001FB41DF0|nr:L-lactate dehydrogenase [Rhodococcus sp. ARC_M6]MCJ0904173.1 L-lactate dehydrogenase [Rhodococcus sp. ARC_M6]